MRFTGWELEPEIYGYAAAVTNKKGRILREAAVTVRSDGSAVFDIIGQDGMTILTQGEAETLSAAMKAAKEAMKIH
jgi:hypothetical protein